LNYLSGLLRCIWMLFYARSRANFSFKKNTERDVNRNIL